MIPNPHTKDQMFAYTSLHFGPFPRPPPLLQGAQKGTHPRKPFFALPCGSWEAWALVTSWGDPTQHEAMIVAVHKRTPHTRTAKHRQGDGGAMHMGWVSERESMLHKGTPSPPAGGCGAALPHVGHQPWMGLNCRGAFMREHAPALAFVLHFIVSEWPWLQVLECVWSDCLGTKPSSNDIDFKMVAQGPI